MAHTPGPWVLKVSTLAPPAFWVESVVYNVARIMTGGRHRDESEANGRLIAAAPELLAERKAISNRLGLMEWSSPEHAQELLTELIREFHPSAAIAKAEAR